MLAVPAAINDMKEEGEEEPVSDDDHAEVERTERGSLVEAEEEENRMCLEADMEKSGLVRDIHRSDTSFRRKTALCLIVVAVLMLQLVYFVVSNDENENVYSFSHLKAMFSHSNVVSSSDMAVDRFSNETNDKEEEALLLELRDRLVPQPLRWNGSTLLPQQFIHLHHMKTGGTSLDDLIKCGIERLRKLPWDDVATPTRRTVAYTTIHECSEAYYAQCTAATASPRRDSCQKQVIEAAVLSYCAPLHDLQAHFSWHLPANRVTSDNDSSSSGSTNDTPHAVTILRHPVDRVWSMYRFQTKACYGCRPLLDIYRDLDAGNTTSLRPICRAQLLNHQTRNLLSSALQDVPTTPEHVAEAIANLQHTFTLIGLTADMPTTARMVAHVFPWLAEQLDLSLLSTVRSNSSSLPTCPLPHKNASPSNNRCGPQGTDHLPLPDVPDFATQQAIRQHNALDLQLYAAAQRQFARQKRVLGL
jgi:hypothetical protein